MSYKHTLALTAFGIGAFLQGCSKDDDDECTVNCEDKCKDIDNYEGLTKSGTVEADCVTCIGNFDGVAALTGDEDTDISRWSKAWANAQLATATDEQKQLPIDALNYCGAKQVTQACSGTTPIDYVTELTDIDAAVLAIALANTECGVCYLLQPASAKTCATAHTALEACGNVPGFDCEADYRCSDVKTYHDIKDGAASPAVVAGCETCLDEAAKALDTPLADYAAAKGATDVNDETSDDFAVVADLWSTCGNRPLVSQCATLSLGAADVTPAAVLTKAGTLATDNAQFNCGVCFQSQISDTSTCADVSDAAEDCGVDVTSLDCTACDDLSTGCAACAIGANGGALTAQHATPAADADFVKAVQNYAYCGLEFDGSTAAQFSACDTVDLSVAASADDTGVGTVVDGLANTNAACNQCIMGYVGLNKEGARTCANYNEALEVCATAGQFTKKSGCPA